MGLRWAGDKKLPKQPGASSGLARWSLGLGSHVRSEAAQERQYLLAKSSVKMLPAHSRTTPS